MEHEWNADEPAISVAIPTMGRPDLAVQAARSAAEQDASVDFEVLVLDNACDQTLAQRVRQLATEVATPVAYVPVAAVGLHSGRHEGARRARGSIIAYLDDDAVPQPGWLDGLSAAFEDPDVHLVGGRCLPLYEADPPDWLEAFWSRTDDGVEYCGPLSIADHGDDARDIDPTLIFGANFAIRTRSLIELGGFHPDGVPWRLRRFRGDGETAVAVEAMRRGYRAAYHPAASVLHRVSRDRMTTTYFERKAYLKGISDSFADARNRSRHATLPRIGERVVRRLKVLGARPARRARSTRWKDLLEATTRAGEEGYAYHREQMRSDPVVAAWVERDHYWDAVIPDPSSTLRDTGGMTGNDEGATRQA